MMSTYKEVAPILSRVIGVKKFREDNPPRAEPVPEPDAPPSKAKVEEIYQALLTMEERGVGDRRIARKCGVGLHWVRIIQAEMDAAKTALYS